MEGMKKPTYLSPHLFRGNGRRNIGSFPRISVEIIDEIIKVHMHDCLSGRQPFEQLVTTRVYHI